MAYLAVDPESLFVTNGVSGALGLICSLFVQKGDTIIVENPSYFLALSIFRDFGLNIIPIDLDEQGLRTQDLETLLRTNPSIRPKLVYTIPVFHNPTGYSLSHERKIQLAKLAAEYNFTVLADEVYQLLGFEGVPKPTDPCCYYDTPEIAGPNAGHIISIGSFAKILAPGMRLGWLQCSTAGNHLLKKIYNCGQLDSSGALNPVISGIVHTLIESGAQKQHLSDVRTELTKRATILGDALRKSLPAGATFIQPSGGYFIWIRIPQGLHGMKLMDFCIAGYKCRFHPGERFGTNLDNYIRLSFSYYNANDLAVGAERLGQAMRDMLTQVASSPAPVVSTPSTNNGISVAVHGGNGRLGSLIVNAAKGQVPGSPLANLTGVITRDNTTIPSGTSVIIDVTLPAGTASLIKKLLSNGAPYLPLVIGTTGDLPMDLIKEYAKVAPVVLSANFSVGVPLVLSKLQATKGNLPSDWHAEVTEIHHTAKKDAPSGTAKRLITGLENAGVQAVTGPNTPIPVHALRLGDTVGVHTIFLAGPGERVEITHTATRREVFAIGAIRLAGWLVSQPPGFYVK